MPTGIYVRTNKNSIHPNTETRKKLSMAKSGKNNPSYNPLIHTIETRICACGCKNTFKCESRSKKKFIQGHNNQNKHHSSETKNSIANTLTGKPKSVEHIKHLSGIYHADFSGNKNPNWKDDKGTTTLLCRIRTSLKYRQWRSDVFTLQDFTCQECNERGGWKEAHHIKPFALIIKENNIATFEGAMNCVELWNINNGKTLCKKCHDKTKNGGRARTRTWKSVTSIG